MKHLLTVVCDERKRVSLKFCSLADANRFLELANVYMDETGCGNGYSAYWPNYFYIPGSRFLPFIKGIIIHSKPRPYFGIIKKERNFVNIDMIHGMLFRVLKTRLAISHPDWENFPCKIESTKNGLKFELGALPGQLRPGPGDMYRVPRSRLDKKNVDCDEGTVKEDLGEKLVVIPCWESGKENPKTFLIKADQAIKIDNWLVEMKSHLVT